jgi:alanine racemase
MIHRRTLLAAGALAPILPAAARVPAAARSDRYDPWVEISASALAHNVGEITRQARVPLWACVKAHGFNLDEVNVARSIDAAPGTAGYMVTRAEEAFRLAQAGLRKPVLMMAPCDDATAVDLARAGVRLAVTGSDDAARMARLFARTRRPLRVHWDIDTGIHRQGLMWWQAAERCAELWRTGAVRVEGTASYFIGGKQGETPPYAADLKQLDRFEQVIAALRAAAIPVGQRHFVSSTNYFGTPQGYYDAVRCGALLYGGYPTAAERAAGLIDLRSTYQLKARVAQITLVKAGEAVGYAGETPVARDTWAAMLLVGTIDGYRPKPGLGGALLNGRFRPAATITGTQMTILLGERPDAALGDEAIVLGSAPEVRPETVHRSEAWANYVFRPTLKKQMIA